VRAIPVRRCAENKRRLNVHATILFMRGFVKVAYLLTAFANVRGGEDRLICYLFDTKAEFAKLQI